MVDLTAAGPPHLSTGAAPDTPQVSCPDTGQVALLAMCRNGQHAWCPDRLWMTGQHPRCGCPCHSGASGVVSLGPASGPGSPLPAADPAGDRKAVAPRSHAERLAYVFYLVTAFGAVIGQVWVAMERIPWPQSWPVWGRVAVTLPFAVGLELLGMITAGLADERMRLGERALGLRVFSAVVATVAVAIIVVGHWPDPYLVVGFGAFSGAAYVLWLLHAAARRRDALRQKGLLNRVTPAYGLHRWLPLWGRSGWRVTYRARELARAHGLDLYESLRRAEADRREELRRPAIAQAVRAVIRANHADPLMADIAVQTLDHDRIADELAARADYAGWAQRLAGAVSAWPDWSPTHHGELSGLEPAESADTEQPVSGQGPDTEAVRVNGAKPVTAEQVARALNRKPRPTQVEVAQELGVSERTVRRALRRKQEDRA